MKRRIYSKEFKLEAVRLSYTRDNVKALAEELSIPAQRLYKWRKQAQDKVLLLNESSKNDDSIKIKRLEKLLREKELELERLKKAVHIFSKSDGKSISL